MVNVICSLGHVPWEQQFINSLGHPMFGVSVTKRCVDGIDILAAVRTIDVDAVVVSDGVLRVDANCVAEALAQGIRFIAVTEQPEVWRELGVVDVVVVHRDDMSAMVQQIIKMMRDHSEEHHAQQVVTGNLVAITGFGGASGRTQCALQLSRELAKHSSTCLVDADVYAPSLAQELGCTELNGGILGLTRLAELRKLSDISLHETSVSLESDLIFLRGIPSAHRWTDLRIHALKSMWEYLETMTDFVIADCGPAYDLLDRNAEVTAKPTRAIASLTAIDAAQSVVITANASDVGITRLINGYLDLHEFVENKDVFAVVHGIANESAQRDIKAIIARELGVNAIVTLSHDSYDYSELAAVIAGEVREVNKTARRGIIRRRAA